MGKSGRKETTYKVFMVVDTTQYRDFDETVGTGWGRRHRWICSFVWLVGYSSHAVRYAK